MDLLLFHRRLRWLVIIDLKIEPLSHANIGQTNLYWNYARAHRTQPDERYALDGLPNQMLVCEYMIALPVESHLARELNRVRGALARQVELRLMARNK